MLQVILYGFVFLLGLVGGSFLSVLVSRLDREKGIWLGRSHCPNCKKTLIWYELIPVLSFVLQYGRCRHCRVKISPFYPVLELITGLLFVAVLAMNPGVIGVLFFIKLLIVSTLIGLVFFDLKYFILPDKLTAALVVLGVFHVGLSSPGDWFGMFTSGVGAGAFFAIIHGVSRGRWMGLGDAKLAVGSGFVLGYPFIFWTIAVAIWTAAAVGLVLVGLGRANFKTALPFGAFLAAFTLLFFIFGHEIQSNISFIEGIY